VIEATHSNKWKRHLEEDLGKAEKRGYRLAGYLFVAWCNKPKSAKGSAELERYRERFRQLGVPPDELWFVFKRELVAALTKPAFAHVWLELLKLPVSCYPFQPIDEASTIFGSERDPKPQIPTLREYPDGIHRPRLADDVEARLKDKDRRWALVRGHGAAGKTVLAAQVGLKRRACGFPAYYIDLGEFSEDGSSLDMGRVLEVVTSRTDANVLFIVDNVHLIEKQARAIYDHWRQCGDPGELLMLGRRVTEVDARGRPRPLGDLETDALDLTVGVDDLAGVFARLKRKIKPGTSVHVPRGVALDEWARLFGEDLVAFSAAVTGRIDSLEPGNWQLRPHDAVAHVRKEYLDTLDGTQRANLIRVAAFATLEIEAPLEVLERGGLKDLIERGVVQEFARGRQGEFIRFHLHEGMGRLLLAAELPAQNTLSILLEAVQRYPLCGMVIAGRLDAKGRRGDAVTVLRVVESQPALGKAVVRPGLASALAGCHLLEDLEVVRSQELDERLCEDEGALNEGLLRTPLGGVSPFIQYAEAVLPKFMKLVASQLQKETVVAAYARAACGTPSDDLVSFLRGSPNAAAVVSRIDKNIWEREQLSGIRQHANAMFTLFKLLGDFGRKDLKNAPAIAWVRNPVRAEGKIPDVGLHHVGTTLIFARAEGSKTIARFLNTVVKKEWLQEQFARSASTGNIAGFLYSLWGYQEKEVRSYFDTPELRTRVEREVANLRSKEGKGMFESIQLLGCAALFGVIIECAIEWPSNEQVCDVFSAQVFKKEREDIGNIQVQLWLGLRELAQRRGPGRFKIPAAEGDKALGMWKKARGTTRRHEALNALMIEWLERCSRAGWHLEPDPMTLVEPEGGECDPLAVGGASGPTGRPPTSNAGGLPS
jgi:hypothetical protein